jgi:hypothetical protein
LLDSHDFGTLLVTSELVRGPHKAVRVGHPIFSAEPLPADEYSCVYYVFHMPGSKDTEMLQTTYWVDVPAGSTPAAWSRAWTQARSAGQLVPGIGDEAFFSEGRLTFQAANVYVTIAIADTKLDPSTGAGLARQTTIEQQLAQDVLGRLR